MVIALEVKNAIVGTLAFVFSGRRVVLVRMGIVASSAIPQPGYQLFPLGRQKPKAKLRVKQRPRTRHLRQWMQELALVA